MKLVLAAFVLLTVPALTAQSAVHVVDPANGPGTDFTSLAAAVAAVANGDVLLLRAAHHPALTIDGKALVLAADSGASVTLDELTIQNLPAGKNLVVRGLAFAGTPSDGALLVQDCPGSVWLEGCSVASTHFPLENCVTCQDCAAVVFESCQVLGIFLGSCQATGAIHALRSSVYVYGGSVRGAEGVTGSFPVHYEIDGQAAIYAEDGVLWIQGSDIRGGGGGSNYNPADCLGSSDGAPGIVLTGGAPLASILDCTIQGGFGGLGYCGPDGHNAPPIDAPPGSVTTIAKSARTLETHSPVRGDETTTLTFHGLAGDRVLLVYALTSAPGLRSGLFVGPLLLGSPHAALFAGTLGVSGTLALNVGPVGPGAGVEGLCLFAQALFVNRTRHENVFSNPSHVVLLDPSF